MTAPPGAAGAQDIGMSRWQRPGRPDTSRAGWALVEWVQDRLSGRDWEIVEIINRVRVATGEQLERLCFASLSSPRSRIVSRSAALRRLVVWRVLVPLERRIGGASRGSSGSAFALDTVGQKLIALRQRTDAEAVRVRRPGTPSDRTLKHLLAISELYTRSVELSRQYGAVVEEFLTEPGCWWPNGLGGSIKPDAYVRLSDGEVIDHWWVEHDEATESLPTLRTKLLAYLDFAKRGQLGPSGLQPRVLVSTISERRRAAIEGLVSRLPPPATQLFVVVESATAADQIFTVLRE